MSQIMAWGRPLSKRNHSGEAAVMSLVKYRPQSVPAKTCCGNFGFAMIESTGTFGRLPLLFSQVNVAQLAVQVTWKTCPGVVGVLALNPPIAAYPFGAVVVVGSNATSRIGRLGRMALLPVTSTHVALAEPEPIAKPICTLPSLVPTMTLVWSAGSNASWLI